MQKIIKEYFGNIYSKTRKFYKDWINSLDAYNTPKSSKEKRNKLNRSIKITTRNSKFSPKKKSIEPDKFATKFY